MAKTPKPVEVVVQAAMLHVTGPAKGRWRTGRLFGAEVTVLAVDDLTESEIDMLMADPELAVVEVAAAEPVLPPSS